MNNPNRYHASFGLAYIKPTGDCCSVIILFDGSKDPIEMMHNGTVDSAHEKLAKWYPNVQVVDQSHFLSEMDSIKLFNCRLGDGGDWTAPMTQESVADLAQILAKQQMWIDKHTKQPPKGPKLVIVK